MNEGKSVEYELRDDIAWIRFNRPERLNAVVPELVEQFVASLERAILDRVSVAVIAGRGRSFCAGHDLKQEHNGLLDDEERRRLERVQDVTRLVRRAPFPVVAAVHGYALGAGCEFALCCDLILATEDAMFGFPEVGVGLSVTGGISHVLPISVGLAKAKELVLLGENFTAGKAYELGLINFIVPTGSLEEEAMKLAQRLRDRPRDALKRAKFVLDRSSQGTIDMAYELELDAALASRGSADALHAEAVFRARNTRREPGNNG
ncbi:MAG: enoyl-CoA hydratase/isomerase family protein [Ferrimicrobium sp.]